MVRTLASELAGHVLAASPDQVIRTVGDYEGGVCGQEQGSGSGG